jgi:hypothetical protein
MKSKEKLTRQNKAAAEIAEIMFGSLQKFPEAEQQARIRKIEKIKIHRTPVGKPAKRASTRRNPRGRRLRASA